MTDALTIGWTAARVGEYRSLYRRVLGLNLILHLLIGLACIFFPGWVADTVDLPGPIPTGWTRGWGATLILVTALYVPGWLNPIRRAPNLIGILGRFWMGTIWLAMWLLSEHGFLWFFLFDYFFAAILALLYWRYLRATLMSRP